MIQPQTYLTVADNSGAKKIMCIRVLGNSKQYGNIGDVIIGVVKEATPNMPVKRSDIVRAVIVRTKHTLRRNDGMSIRFDDNAAVLLIKKITHVEQEFLDQLHVKSVIEVLQKLYH